MNRMFRRRLSLLLGLSLIFSLLAPAAMPLYADTVPTDQEGAGRILSPSRLWPEMDPEPNWS